MEDLVVMRRFSMIISLVFALDILITSAGCAGLQRTSLESWKETNFSTMGISVEMPTKALLVETGLSPEKKKGSGYRSLNFYLHPIYSEKVISEPIYIVNCWIYRLSAENYGLFKKKEHDLSFDWQFKDHYQDFHTEVTNYVAKNYVSDGICFRKDIKCPNGDIVLVTVMYGSYKQNKSHEKEDIEAIKRIINSVKVLDVQKNADVPSAGK